MKAKKILGLILVGGLLFGALGAAEAAKRKPKKTTLTFYLHYSGSGGECGSTYVDRKDVPDAGNSCATVIQPANEALHQAGQALVVDWPDSSGTKFKLDTSKPFKAALTVGGAGIGETTIGHVIIDLTVTAQASGRAVTLFEGSVEKSVTPVDRLLEFSGRLPRALGGKTLSGLNVQTTLRGVSTAFYIELDDPPSTISVPALK